MYCFHELTKRPIQLEMKVVDFLILAKTTVQRIYSKLTKGNFNFRASNCVKLTSFAKNNSL